MLHAILDDEARSGGGGGSWDPFGWINQWGHSQGLEPAWVGDAIYAHFVGDIINEMYSSSQGGYWHHSMSSPKLFSSNSVALDHASNNNPDITKEIFRRYWNA